MDPGSPPQMASIDTLRVSDETTPTWSDTLSMAYYRAGSTLFVAFLDDPAWIAFWFC